MEKIHFDKNSTLISGEILSLDSDKIKLQVGEKQVIMDKVLFPKNLQVKDQVVISIMKEDAYEALKEKKAKDLLNEILGN